MGPDPEGRNGRTIRGSFGSEAARHPTRGVGSRPPGFAAWSRHGAFDVAMGVGTGRGVRFRSWPGGEIGSGARGQRTAARPSNAGGRVGSDRAGPVARTDVRSGPGRAAVARTGPDPWPSRPAGRATAAVGRDWAGSSNRAASAFRLYVRPAPVPIQNQPGVLSVTMLRFPSMMSLSSFVTNARSPSMGSRAGLGRSSG